MSNEELPPRNEILPEDIPPADSALEDSERTAWYLNTDNQHFFEQMPQKARNIANQVYEGLYNIPVVNRVVGKMEIAYNQFWLDRHEEKAIKFKEKTEGLDIRIGSFDQSKAEIESAIIDLQRQNIPGIESLQVKLRDIETSKLDLLNERDKYQSKFEKKDNKVKLYTNERDRVADKLIDYYGENLEPMEKELENLETCMDRVDLLEAVMVARHREQSAKLTNIEKRKTQIEEALKNTGMSDKEIAKFEAIETLDDLLIEGRADMSNEKENLARRKAEINKRVAKVDANANPYRDKREEFLRIKENRPVKIEMAGRKRGRDSNVIETTRGHTRGESEETALEREIEVPDTETVEISEEMTDQYEITQYVSGWNTLITERYKKEAPKKTIDVKDFLKATGLREHFKLDSKDFVKIIEKYYKFRKIPTNTLNADMKALLEFVERIKKEKE